MKNPKLAIGLTILLAIIIVAVGFATINVVNIKISGLGSATSAQSNFKIKFTGTPSLDNETRGTARITGDLTGTLDVRNLSSKGDSVSATYTIINNSKDLKATLTAIATNTNTTWFNVTTTLADENIEAGNTTTLTVKVELLKTPLEDQTTTIRVMITTNPEVDNITYPTGKTASTVKTGDIITIGTESFYVLENKTNQITALAMYNLKVGRIYTDSSNYTEIATTENHYGRQDSEMQGYDNSSTTPEKYPRKGTTAFYGTTPGYWWDSDNRSYKNNYTKSEKKDENGKYYVYDSNSLIYTYITEYKEILGSAVSKVELPTYNQIYKAAGNTTKLTNGPSWLYSTSYWLGSGKRDTKGSNVWNVTSDGNLGTIDCDNADNCGVRPVITINK